MAEVCYGNIIAALEKSNAFYHSQESVQYVIEYIRKMGECVLREVPEVRTIFADGFPFYTLRRQGIQLPVHEIARFHREQIAFYKGMILYDEKLTDADWDQVYSFKELRKVVPSAFGVDPYTIEKQGGSVGIDVSQYAALNISLREWKKLGAFVCESDTWPCPSCAAGNTISPDVTKEHIGEDGRLINLRAPCIQQCRQTPVKPRGLLRVLPDCDPQFIVDGDPAVIAPKIRSVLHRNGFYCDDEQLDQTVLLTGIKLPADITVVNVDEWNRALKEVEEYVGSWQDVTADVVKLWYRNERINWIFGKNFVLHIEPILGKNTEDKENFDKARNMFAEALKRVYGEKWENIIREQLSKLSRYHGRLMQQKEIREAVLDRFRSTYDPEIFTIYRTY